MKKIFFSGFLLCLCITCSICQKQEECRVVLTLNDNLLYRNSLSDLHLLILKKDKTEERVELDYFPGYLSFNTLKAQTKESLLDSIFLVFNNHTFSKKHHLSKSYVIPFNLEWLKIRSIVVNIYDTDKGKFKGVFHPLSKKQPYTFELETGEEHSFRRLRIK